MYKIWSLIGFLSLIFVSCSKDEPGPDVFMQIASITDEDGSVGRQISYDSYGRVIGYKCSYPNESVVAEYEYVSDDLVKISTEDIIFSFYLSFLYYSVQVWNYKYTTFKSVCQVPAAFSSIQAIIS